MGETYAEVVLGSDDRQVRKNLLVDTGSTYSWIDSKTLEKLGIKPLWEDNFETIEGRILKKKIGEIIMLLLP